jgi:hypothetical protein
VGSGGRWAHISCTSKLADFAGPVLTQALAREWVETEFPAGATPYRAERLNPGPRRNIEPERVLRCRPVSPRANPAPPDLAGLPLQASRRQELMGRQHTRCRPVSRGHPVGSFIDSRLPRSSMGPPLPSAVGNSQAQPHTARPVTWPTIRARGPSPGVTLDRVAMRPTVPQEEPSAPVASAAGDIGSRGRPATGRGASRILPRSDGPST